ncbi:MAG TPA: glycosyl hydrolase family 5, partial [Armatimonadota bacterium]|nr:glycosyl hydrolase family 5 [Armatimonadota bacterium]
MNTRATALCAAMLLLTTHCLAAQWEMVVTDRATVEIRHDQTPIVKADYLFWGADWKWAGAQMKVEEGARGFTGTVADLGLSIVGTVTTPAPNVMRVEYEVTAEEALRGIIGGGLEWGLLLDSPSFATPASEPELLPDNAGLSWGIGENETIEIAFDPALPNVYFERGQKNTARAMLVGADVAKGTTRVAMTITIPEGGTLARSLAERYGPVDVDAWTPDGMLWNQSPVDLSFLNEKPAGEHGFVKADGDRLVFEDGTRVRFWGGNIAAYAIFADKDEIAEQAKRIAQLGYNLMRIHHHDSTRWVSPTVIDKEQDDSRQFDADAMDRLDWWVKCLKDEGVYVWLDLHVGREFKVGDGIDVGFDEIERRNNEGKGFCYFNDRVEELMREFNEAYLNHENPYTGLAYKEDPVVMGLLITNENELTFHFGNLMLGDKGNPAHNALFNQAVSDFSDATGLPQDATGRTWEHGPSKIFLNNQEREFNARMLEHLGGLGVKVPVATTNTWGNMGLAGLPALTAGGIIDVHSYGGDEALAANPRTSANYISWIAAGQVHDKPVSITEWNVPYPSRDRFTSPLYVASIAALQGWDAPMIYNYSQRGFGQPDRQGQWSSFSDAGLTAITPAAAIAFRRGDISEARTEYCLDLDREQLYYEGLDPTKSAAIRTLAEQSKLTIGLPDVPELDWDEASQPNAGVAVITDPHGDFIPAG